MIWKKCDHKWYKFLFSYKIDRYHKKVIIFSVKQIKNNSLNYFSSTSSDPDIRFFISGDDGSEDEEVTLTPSSSLNPFQPALISRRLSNSSESDYPSESISRRTGTLLPSERLRHLSGSV